MPVAGRQRKRDDDRDGASAPGERIDDKQAHSRDEALRQGDDILASHLLASPDDVWVDATTPPAAARSIPPKG
ncbi:hypothetical protein G3O00_28990 [Burkholderia sp. Ac-20384]|uniref:hypothetical protein n=1 Tax=Burkholderia TaxID=32008 RepID=UPI0015831661|nr:MULTISPECIES: hypothetical protein [Burkholderia]MBN3827631.1 hypothetical protein [Burkholderia sp. Ac-20384]